ncbi:MAG TPA: proton-conducting transporter membrane subunit [Streptosporangiaceae bacterium]|nr:proton-conducting transporter membrane subunit [Streptosporangiaceae bacterium]
MIALAAVAIVLPFLGAVAGLLPAGLLPAGLLPGGPLSGGPSGGRLSRLALGRPRATRAGPAVVAIAPVAVSTLLTLIVALAVWTDPGARTRTLAVVPTGTVPFEVGVYVDGLSAAVAFMVCCVALAVQVYSSSFMAADRRHRSFAALVSLFTAAMLLVVLSGDLIVLFAGWEVMGLCSCLLIGHRRARVALLGFLITGAGDVAFLFGIFVLGVGAGTFSVRGVLAYDYPQATAIAGTLLLVAGFASRSVRCSSYMSHMRSPDVRSPEVRSPDAAVAGTPAGALIHATAMAAAGVYVVARIFPVFARAPATLTVLGVLAGISMLGAALAALVQDDLTMVLAYSTISQVGYMAAGLAAGARDAAIFQLLAHGAYKALLFLGAGCVIAVVGSGLLRDMGGLRLAMPVTFWSMSIGWAALAGVPVASGFFSVDAILAAVQHAAVDHAGGTAPAADSAAPGQGIAPWAAVFVYVALLLTVAVTGAYAARAWLMTFFGERRAAPGAVPVSASVPALMRWPVAALAVPSLVLGFFGLGSAVLRPEPTPTLAGLAMVAAGAGAAFVVWNRDPALDPARVLGRPVRAVRTVRTVLARAFSLGGGDERALLRPVRALAGFAAAADERVVAAAVEGTGRAMRRLGGPLRTTAAGGNPQAYVTGLLAGVAVIALAVVVFR